MAPKRISLMGECFLYSVSENIPPIENSNVLKCDFIQPEVAVWRNKKAQEPESATEQRGLCFKGVEVMPYPLCQLELAMDCPFTLSWASQGRSTYKETFFPSAKEEAGRLKEFMIPWLAYWEFSGQVAHTEILLRNSKGFACRNFHLKVKRRKWLSF